MRRRCIRRWRVLAVRTAAAAAQPQQCQQLPVALHQAPLKVSLARAPASVFYTTRQFLFGDALHRAGEYYPPWWNSDAELEVLNAVTVPLGAGGKDIIIPP